MVIDMANTSPRERTERIVILLTKAERKSLNAKAKKRKEVMSQTVRAAIAHLPIRGAK